MNNSKVKSLEIETDKVSKVYGILQCSYEEQNNQIEDRVGDLSAESGRILTPVLSIHYGSDACTSHCLSRSLLVTLAKNVSKLP